MNRPTKKLLASLLAALSLFTGCHPSQPFYLHSDHDLSHFLDKATDAEYPDYEQPRLAEVDNAGHPFVVSNPDVQEVWDVSLEECVGVALQNSKVIRNAGSIQGNFGFSDALIERIATLQTTYDPAIVESQTSGQTRLVGPTGNVQTPNGGIDRATNPVGVEDALSEFDAQPFLSASTNRLDRPQNSGGFANTFQPSYFRQLDSDLTMALSKKSAFGNVTTFRSRTDFTLNNQASSVRPIPGDWLQNLEAEVNVPLARGAGVQINRIPVVLARINTDISIADFESAVRNLLMDIETAYWDLHNSYRALDAARIGRDSAHVTWKIVYEKYQKGAENAQNEAQSRGQYFQFRAAAETALRDLYSTENRLRWLMGLAATDGRLIRPKDEPTVARVDFEWHDIHAEALFRSTELRQHKWRIKQRELELVSARNQLLPQVNVQALYRWLGRGDHWMNADRNGLDFPSPGSTAMDELFGGQFQEATFGVNVLPARIGARRELSGVRNAQLQLARSKAQLEEMELNLSHLLTAAIRSLDSDYVTAQSNYGFLIAAETEVNAVQSLYEGGRITLDLVLDAQRRRSQAQSAFYQALTNYNKSLANVHYRKGTLLEHNGIKLAEGPWPAKAYWDALGQARQRDASYYMNYGVTRPRVVSRGSTTGDANEPYGIPFEQLPGTGASDGASAGEAGEEGNEGPVPTPRELEGPRGSDPPRASTTPGTVPNGRRSAGVVVPASATAPLPRPFEWGNLGLENGDGDEPAPVDVGPNAGSSTAPNGLRGK